MDVSKIKETAVTIGAYVNKNEENATAGILKYLEKTTDTDRINNFEYIAKLLKEISKKYIDTKNDVITGEDAQEMQQYLISSLKELGNGDTLTDDMVKQLFDNVDEIQNYINRTEAEYNKNNNSGSNSKNDYNFNLIEEVTDSTKGGNNATQEANPTTNEVVDDSDINTLLDDNQASLGENVDGNSNHLLIELLNRTEKRKNDQKDYVDAIDVEDDDTDNALPTKFNEKDYKIGDKSVVKYKKDDILNKVTANTQTNTMTISHKNGKGVKTELIADSLFATIDYMKKTNQVPFVFKVNTKTPEFLKTAFSFVLSFTKYEASKLSAEEANNRKEFIKNVKAFKFNDVEVPIKSVLGCETVDDYNRLVDSIFGNKNTKDKQNNDFEKGTEALNDMTGSENEENIATSDVQTAPTPAPTQAQTPTSKKGKGKKKAEGNISQGISSEELNALLGNKGR